MANAFYNPSGAPVTSSFGASASIRAEFSAIAAGFDKLPSSLTANKAVVVNAGATGLTISTGTLTLNGNLSVATGKTVTLSNTLTFTGTDGSSVNFGAGGTVVFGVSGTANEISVSTVSGTATVSLPTSLTFTGKTVTGGTFASPTFSGTVAGAHSYSGAITFTGNISQNGDTTQLRVQNTATTSAVVLSTVKGWLGSGVDVTNMAIGVTAGLNVYVNNSSTVALSAATTGSVSFPNGINSTNIGATTPGTGAFTTVSNTGETITSTSATALTVGRQGSTNPVLQIDASTASVVTGIKVTGAAAAGGVAISAISSGANEGISFDGKGSGDINIGGVSSGFVKIGAATGQGVLIGIATTTVGAIANSIPTLVGTISTFNGSVGGLSLNTWVTACTLPNGSIWEVSCFASIGAAGYSASGVAVNDSGSGAMAQGGVGPSMQIQMSGTSLQIRQTASGGTLTGYFTLKRVW